MFADISEGGKILRNEKVVEAHITHGYTQKEIGDCLGVHFTTVSKVLTGKSNK
jgi:DNA-binding XRE family transcriptional regulator